jgi:class 3 adenylate cyclase
MGHNRAVQSIQGLAIVAQGLPEGTVTVLFTDVEGSTDLTTRRGDEAAQKILRAQRELVRQQVERHSGHEVKSLGDGFMVAFASARRAGAPGWASIRLRCCSPWVRS